MLLPDTMTARRIDRPECIIYELSHKDYGIVGSIQVKIAGPDAGAVYMLPRFDLDSEKPDDPIVEERVAIFYPIALEIERSLRGRDDHLADNSSVVRLPLDEIQRCLRHFRRLVSAANAQEIEKLAAELSVADYAALKQLANQTLFGADYLDILAIQERLTELEAARKLLN